MRPVVRFDFAGVAQHMGGVACLIPPGGGGLDARPRQGVLLHLGDKGDIHPPGEHILAVVHLMPAQVQLVEHPGQLPVFLGNAAPLVGEAQALSGRAHHPGQLRALQPGAGRLFNQPEGLAHQGEQLPGGEVGLFRMLHPAALLRQPSQGGLVENGLPLLIDGGVPLLIHSLGGQGDVGGVAPRGAPGDGQAVGPLHPLLPADLQQAGEDIQPVRAHGVPVQGDVIAHLVGDQHPAVAVQDLSPDAVHHLGLGHAHAGVGAVAGAADNLGLIEHGHKARQHRAEDGDEQVGAQLEAAGLPFRLLLLDVGGVKGVIHGISSRS